MGRESIFRSKKTDSGQRFYKQGVVVLHGDELFVTDSRGEAIPTIYPNDWVLNPDSFEEDGDIVLGFSKLLAVMY